MTAYDQVLVFVSAYFVILTIFVLREPLTIAITIIPMKLWFAWRVTQNGWDKEHYSNPFTKRLSSKYYMSLYSDMFEKDATVTLRSYGDHENVDTIESKRLSGYKDIKCIENVFRHKYVPNSVDFIGSLV